MQYTRIGNLAQGENCLIGYLTRTSQNQKMHEHEVHDLVEYNEEEKSFIYALRPVCVIRD
jgi:tRNA threonylcarbamoyladenosine modification (KEOPS) complex Cgi121 subunit